MCLFEGETEYKIVEQTFLQDLRSHGDLGSYTQVAPVAPCSGRRCQPFPGSPVKMVPETNPLKKRHNKKKIIGTGISITFMMIVDDS